MMRVERRERQPDMIDAGHIAAEQIDWYPMI